MSEVKVGQVWREVDPRVQREVRVVRVGDGGALIMNLATKRTTAAQLWRFNGKRGGYELVRDV